MKKQLLLLVLPFNLFCMDIATIFKKNDKAMQGSKNTYIESKVTFHLDNQEVIEKLWQKSESGEQYSKQEVAYPNGTTKLSGFDGKDFWAFYFNREFPGSPSQKVADFNKLLRKQEYKNPKSTQFFVNATDNVKIGNEECYSLVITNKILPEITVKQYYSTKTFFLVKEAFYSGKQFLHEVDFADYKSANGLAPEAHLKTRTVLTKEGPKVQAITKVETYKPLGKNVSFEAPKPKQFAKLLGDKKSITAPFLLSKGHVFLPVKIGNTEKLWLIDTGYTVTQIDSSYARELGLKGSFPQGIAGQFGQALGYATKLPEMHILDRKTKESIVSARPVEGLQKNIGVIAKKVGEFPAKELGGILGVQFLSQFVVEVDYAKSEIAFYDKEKFAYKGSGYKSPLGVTGTEMFIVPVELLQDGKKIKGNFTVDLGSSFSSFVAQFSKDNGLDKLSGITGEFAGAGVEESEVSRPFSFVVNNNWKLEDIMFNIPKEDKNSVSLLDQSSLAGNLGYPFLKNFKIYFDYKDNHVILEKGANFNKKNFKQATGLYSGNAGIVEFVQPGSMAAKAGFKKGDRVVSINGLPISGLTKEQFGKFNQELADYKGHDFKIEYVPYEVKIKSLNFKKKKSK